MATIGVNEAVKAFVSNFEPWGGATGIYLSLDVYEPLGGPAQALWTVYFLIVAVMTASLVPELCHQKLQVRPRASRHRRERGCRRRSRRAHAALQGARLQRVCFPAGDRRWPVLFQERHHRAGWSVRSDAIDRGDRHGHARRARHRDRRGARGFPLRRTARRAADDRGVLALPAGDRGSCCCSASCCSRRAGSWVSSTGAGRECGGCSHDAAARSHRRQQALWWRAGRARSEPHRATTARSSASSAPTAPASRPCSISSTASIRPIRGRIVFKGRGHHRRAALPHRSPRPRSRAPDRAAARGHDGARELHRRRLLRAREPAARARRETSCAKRPRSSASPIGWITSRAIDDRRQEAPGACPRAERAPRSFCCSTRCSPVSIRPRSSG